MTSSLHHGSFYGVLYIHTLLVLRGVILVGGGGGALLSGERWSEPVLKN